MMAFISKGKKLHVSAYSGHLQVLTNDNDDEISTSTRGLCILYIILIVRKLSKPEDGRYRPKHVVFFPLPINTII